MGIATMDILCCHVTVGDADPSNPMRIQSGAKTIGVQSPEINESYKKLIGTTKVIFPKGSVCRSTIIRNVTLEGRDVSRITMGMMQDGIIIERRSVQCLVDETAFKVGQRINIKLGYNGMLKNMFDGCITGYSSDDTLGVQCKNMAYKLKLRQTPHFETPAEGTMVNEVLEGKYNTLKDTGFGIHSDTKRFKMHIDKIKVTDNSVVVDILSKQSKCKVHYFLKYDANDDGVIPSIVIERPYSSSKAQPVSPEDESTGPYRICFNERVVQSNLEVAKTDPKFLAAAGEALRADEKFFETTVRMNPEYDPATPDSKEFQMVDAMQISKKTHEVTGDMTASRAKTRTKVDLSTYTIVPYMSPHVGISSDRPVEETTEYFRNYNLNGIAGNVTVFGDSGLSPAVQVELIDYRNPSKNGVYLAEEVTTTFGVDGYRQQLNIPRKTRK